MRLRNLSPRLGSLLALPSSGSAAPALAAEPVFPPSSRFGFDPPSDMVSSKRFSGLERLEGGATVSVVELPANAFADLETNFTDENLKAQGFIVSNRQAIKVAGDVDACCSPASSRRWNRRHADDQEVDAPRRRRPTVTGIIIAQATPDAETEETMKRLLTGIHIRPALTLEQQVAALPFRIGNEAGFRPVRVLAGNSVLLTQGTKDEISAWSSRSWCWPRPCSRRRPPSSATPSRARRSTPTRR